MSDPTAGFYRQGLTPYDLKFRDWNDHPPPRDPVEVAAAEGRQHVNQATGTVLFHQNAMPIGEHRGKLMERVPARDLLRYAASRDLRRDYRWLPVIDYVQRHETEIRARLKP